jgi:hypothetical protein
VLGGKDGKITSIDVFCDYDEELNEYRRIIMIVVDWIDDKPSFK